MLKVLAGDLTAQFNIDGKHLARYFQRRRGVIRSLCDQLILHDQILIPTNDFLTVAGLVLILGERNLIPLLESERVRFVRLSGVVGYVRGTGPDGGVLTITDPNRRKPQDSPIDQSAAAALNLIKDSHKESNKIIQLLSDHSIKMDTSDVVDAVRLNSIADLKQTNLWKPAYEFSKPDLVELPGVEKMGVRMIGPGTNIPKNAVDALLGLTLMNMELFLSDNLNCTSTSTALPIGDCLSLKSARIDNNPAEREKLWSLLEVSGVPDLSNALLADEILLNKFLELTQKSDAQEFRKWFHKNKILSNQDILKSYVDLLHQIPMTQKMPAKSLRLIITSLIGLLPGAGPLASGIDAFVVDRLLAQKSPKFFIESMRKFSGKIKISK